MEIKNVWVESLYLQPDGRYTLVFSETREGKRYLTTQRNLGLGCYGRIMESDGVRYCEVDFEVVRDFNPEEIEETKLR